MLNEKFGKHIEKMVGLSLKEIREMSPGKLRKYVEKKNGKKLKVESILNYEHISAEEKDQESIKHILIGIFNCCIKKVDKLLRYIFSDKTIHFD